MTTILDLVVVVMFTYPVMAILVRGRFFGEGHRWSGMSAIALGNAPAYSGRGSFRRRSDRHVDVKLVVDEESSGSAVDTAVVVTEYSEDDGADAPGSGSPEDSSEGPAASSRRSRKDVGSSLKGSDSSRNAAAEGDDAAGAEAGSVKDEEASRPKPREELSEEEKGLSLAERKALRRRKAREEARKNGFGGHAAHGKGNGDV